MCGIAGIIGNYNKEDQNKILQSMNHRGPDGNGFYDNKNLNTWNLVNIVL